MNQQQTPVRKRRPTEEEIVRHRRRQEQMRRRKRIHRVVRLVLLILTALLIVRFFHGKTGGISVARLGRTEVPDWVDVQIIPVDGASRRGEKLEAVNNIVVHYVGNPGSTAQNNHDYFAGDQSEVSSHFLIGLNGEVIQCIPLDEKSSASNHRNRDTISVEVCHPDGSGAFNQSSYDSLVRLTKWLCGTCGLKPTDVIRHYDITGKECPLYYVRNPDAWERFLEDLED